MCRGPRGLPGRPYRDGRPPSARRSDHRDQRRRHDLRAPPTGTKITSHISGYNKVIKKFDQEPIPSNLFS